MKSNHFLIRLFYLLMSTFLIGRIIFMLYNIAFCDYSAWDVVRAWWNGLTQDIVVTSAALALPAPSSISGDGWHPTTLLCLQWLSS